LHNNNVARRGRKSRPERRPFALVMRMKDDLERRIAFPSVLPSSTNTISIGNPVARTRLTTSSIVSRSL
jgi:hypothetical protein